MILHLGLVSCPNQEFKFHVCSVIIKHGNSKLRRTTAPKGTSFHISINIKAFFKEHNES